MEEKKQPPIKLVLISILIYIVANLIVGVISGLLSRFFDIKIASPYSILLSLLPAVYFYQTYKNDFDAKKEEIKKITFGALGFLVIIPIILMIGLRGNRGNPEQNENQSNLEIENLKGEVEELKKSQAKQNQQKPIQVPSNQDSKILSSLSNVIEQWRPKIAYVICAWENIYGNNIYGSGSGLYIYPAVITNEHVIAQKDANGGLTKAKFCTVKLPGDSEVFVDGKNVYNWGNNQDIGTLVIENPTEKMKKMESAPSPICKDTAPIGERVLVLGYPITGSANDITVTEGIVSGYDGQFYITSAKIEQGNSGGVAIMVSKNCYLGIPTFAAIGEVESLGRILDSRTLLQR